MPDVEFIFGLPCRLVEHPPVPRPRLGHFDPQASAGGPSHVRRPASQETLTLQFGSVRRKYAPAGTVKGAFGAMCAGIGRPSAFAKSVTRQVRFDVLLIVIGDDDLKGSVSPAVSVVNGKGCTPPDP